MPLTVIELPGPITTKGTNRIDRVARWYLQKIAHDLGGIYLFHDIGDVNGCDRYEAALQWSRESVTQAVAGGFPDLPAANGTTGNIDKRARSKLADGDCDVPDPMPMLPPPGELPKTGAVVEHVYQQHGHLHGARHGQRGRRAGHGRRDDHRRRRRPSASAPGWPVGQRRRRLRGLRLDDARRRAGGRVIRVTQATEAAVRDAFTAAERRARDHPVRDRRADRDPRATLPRLTGSFITVEGNGATLYVSAGGFANLIEVRRPRRHRAQHPAPRSGYDNLRAQDPTAYNVVFSHVSSTGAADDGISIGYGAHDVTLQWCFLAGNTRSHVPQVRGDDQRLHPSQLGA